MTPKQLKELATNPAAFRKNLLIDGDGEPVRFADCIDPWQKADFDSLDDGWLRVAGRQPKGGKYSRAWLERPRGHSKTFDLAVMATWVLAFSKRSLSGIAAAADRDQARLLRNSIAKLVRLNDWLQPVIDVQNYRVVNTRTDSTLEILSSDAPSSYGRTPDFIVADELVHWSSRDLWDSLVSAAAKRSHCVLIVITNAGYQDTWQWDAREAVREDPGWYFSRIDGPKASWISKDLLDEQRRLLPNVAFSRLWENQWISGSGDALAESEIAACVHSELQPMISAEPGWDFFAGLDLGIKRDCSAFCVLGLDRRHSERVDTTGSQDRNGIGKIRLAMTRVWRPSKGKKIDLQGVEDEIQRSHQRFNLRLINYDPWQAEHLGQRLQRSGLQTQEITFTGKNLQRMASTLLECFADRRIELYSDQQLLSDLRRLRVVEKSYGFRLESPRDSTGHGDLATAFMLALLAAAESTWPVEYSLHDWLPHMF